MSNSNPETTRAENLEEKFEAGEEVLDYFDSDRAQVVKPVGPKLLEENRGSTEATLDRATTVREDTKEFPAK